jgi:hypothetical protein
MQLVDGQQLIFLIKKYTGKDVIISEKRPTNAARSTSRTYRKIERGVWISAREVAGDLCPIIRKNGLRAATQLHNTLLGNPRTPPTAA